MERSTKNENESYCCSAKYDILSRQRFYLESKSILMHLDNLNFNYYIRQFFKFFNIIKNEEIDNAQIGEFNLIPSLIS